MPVSKNPFSVLSVGTDDVSSGESRSGSLASHTSSVESFKPKAKGKAKGRPAAIRRYSDAGDPDLLGLGRFYSDDKESGRPGLSRELSAVSRGPESPPAYLSKKVNQSGPNQKIHKSATAAQHSRSSNFLAKSKLRDSPAAGGTIQEDVSAHSRKPHAPIEDDVLSEDGTESILGPVPSVAWTEDTNWTQVAPKLKARPPSENPLAAVAAGNQRALLGPGIGKGKLPQGLTRKTSLPLDDDLRKGHNRFLFRQEGHQGRGRSGPTFRPRFIPDDRPSDSASKRGKSSKYAFMSMVSDPDTRGRAMWRERQRHTREFALPRGFDPTDSSSLPGRQSWDFGHLALATNTYIKPEIKSGHGGDRVLLKIWGAPPDVDQAVKQVEEWLSQIPEECKRDWAKTRAKSTEQRMKRILRAHLKREKFRRPPKPTETFEHIFLIGWPDRDWKIEDILGRSLEGLDSIRMDHRVYITLFKDKETGRNIVQMYVPKNGDFRNALRRLTDIDKQMDAREYEKPRIVLFKPVSFSREAVALLEFSRAKCILDLESRPELKDIPPFFGESGFAPILSKKRLKKSKILFRQRCLPAIAEAGCDDTDDNDEGFPQLDPHLPIEEQNVGTVIVGATDTFERNVQMIEATTICTLRMLQYHRGNLSMRIRLGGYFMDSVKRGPDGGAAKFYPIEQFEELINMSNCEGDSSAFNNFVSKELGNLKLEVSLLETFQQSGRALVPHDRATSSLKEVQPIFMGTFMLRHKNEVIQLQVRFENGRKTERWFRMFAQHNSPTNMMEIILADLEGGASVSFGIEGTLPLDRARLPPNIIIFANSVRLNEAKAMDPHSNERFINYGPEYDPATQVYPKSAMVELISFEQRRYWLFNLRATDWVVELFSFQNAIFLNHSPDKAIPYEPRWGVQMWHEQWDQQFGYNSTQDVGERSQWQPEEWQFFPRSVHTGRDASDQEWTLFEQGSGFREMLMQTEVLTQIVQGRWIVPKSGSKGTGAAGNLGMNVPMLLEDYQPPAFGESESSSSEDDDEDEEGEDGEE